MASTTLAVTMVRSLSFCGVRSDCTIIRRQYLAATFLKFDELEKISETMETVSKACCCWLALRDGGAGIPKLLAVVERIDIVSNGFRCGDDVVPLNEGAIPPNLPL